MFEAVRTLSNRLGIANVNSAPGCAVIYRPLILILSIVDCKHSCCDSSQAAIYRVVLLQKLTN